jgi:Cof subfamily protein (haloacid dehalogenase superfamily)
MTKLVAVDMDGTLLNDKKELPVGFIPWVKSHPSITVAIASGRQYFTLLQMFSEIQNRLLFIAENGGVVFLRGEILYKKTLTREQTLQTITELRKNPEYYIVLCGLHSSYTENDDPEFQDKVNLYYARNTRVKRFEDILDSDEIIKMALYVKDQKAEAAYGRLPGFPEGLAPVLSGVSWIDLALDSVNKGDALRRVQESLGITREETMAFGDYMNDVDMLEAAGDSFAMQNSHPDLLPYARYLAPSNEKAGVMKVLESIIDNKDILS